MQNLYLYWKCSTTIAAFFTICRYFYQLTQGCNQEKCSNPHCAKNLRTFSFLFYTIEASLSTNEAAKKALEFTRKAPSEYYFCSEPTPTLPRTTPQGGKLQQLVLINNRIVTYAQHDAIAIALEVCNSIKDNSYITDLLQRIVSTPESLNNSFFTKEALAGKVDFANKHGVDIPNVYNVFDAITKSVWKQKFVKLFFE